MININDFAKLDIRIVKVVDAVRMEGSEKLLKLTVDIGKSMENEDHEIRQILSGIGKSYNPEQLIGKKLIALVNLEYRKMMGEESQGMILATGDDLENISLVFPEKDFEEGSTIR